MVGKPTYVAEPSDGTPLKGESMSLPLILGLACVVLIVLLARAAARARVTAQPDEWLLCIRNGRLVRAGVGIRLWRRPGDVVVRFTSSL